MLCRLHCRGSALWPGPPRGSQPAILQGTQGCVASLCQAVVMVLESSGDTAVAMMVKLLKVLWETGLITLDQMNRVSVRGAPKQVPP